MKLPNGEANKFLDAWLSRYFSLVGDSQPNLDEIHLEAQDMKDIWEEYVTDAEEIYKQVYLLLKVTVHLIFFDSLQDSHLSYANFIKLWTKCWSYVRIRQYKNVTGKCSSCAILTSLRRKYTEPKLRHKISRLAGLHRCSYMGERRVYYSKIVKACDEPYDYLSLISDGMAQNHTQLPYLANQKDFAPLYPLHLQAPFILFYFFIFLYTI